MELQSATQSLPANQPVRSQSSPPPAPQVATPAQAPSDGVQLSDESPNAPPSNMPSMNALSENFAAKPQQQTVAQRAQDALTQRDFKAQNQLAQELLAKAKRGEAFTAEERTAVDALRNTPQINATLQAAGFQKTITPTGPFGQAFDKTQVGFVLSTDPKVKNGLFGANSVGNEKKFTLPNGTNVVPYAQNTWRSDANPPSLQTGVRVEHPVKLPANFSLTAGADLNNNQSGLHARVERQFNTPGSLNGKTTLGAEVNVSANSNALARETAQRAHQIERNYQYQRRYFEYIERQNK